MAAACLVLLTVVDAGEAPQAELWERWKAHDPESDIRVDHSAWAGLLERYLDHRHPSGISRFAYAKVEPSDRRGLEAYLERLQNVPVSRLDRPEQLAYWINLYNAATIDLVLEHYPLSSIRDIQSPWGRKLLAIEGEELSLDDIEHRILRPIWQDPRIHYAVNCASMGCPNLQPEPFTAENAGVLMDRGARQYVNHPRGVDLRDRTIVASSIYKWYAEDFGGSHEALISHWRRYADPGSAARLGTFDGVVRYSYDWSLNE